jgi:pimeloyl-ACP methyl ester carboxylesterase
VLSLGGHADLPRVLRYLCSSGGGELDDRSRALAEGGESIRIPRPSDYGGVVSLLNLADRAVPAEQVVPLQEAITLFLQASSVDPIDPAMAATLFARARQLGASLPEPSRTLMGHVNERNVAELGRALVPLLAHLELPAALSAERSPAPTTPIFLLHGADDSVVPASEMIHLVQHLRATTGGSAEVRAFASRLITHAETRRQGALAEMWRLADFWRELMEK